MAKGNGGFTIADDAPEPPPRGGGRKRGGRGKDAAPRRDAMAALLDGFDLWCGKDDRQPYASAAGEHYAIPSPQFHDALGMAWYRATGDALSSEALNNLSRLARARAQHDGKTHRPWRRWAAEEGAIFLDLGGADPHGERRCVRITHAGWEILSEAPAAVRFLRSADALAMPAPIGGGEAQPADLCAFVNVPADDPDSVALVWAAIMCACRPALPGTSYPLLILTGEQGSGKTSAGRYLQRLVDASSLDGRGAPKEERDLFISAEARHLTYFDNLSSIRGDMSDALCRISTGGGFTARTLHSDRGETLFSFSRPILANGIPDTLAARGDLAERALVLKLEPFGDARQTDDAVRIAFAAKWPGLLGLLCDGVAAALRHAGQPPPKNLPRMADAAAWAYAAMPGLGLDPEAMLAAWHANRVRADAASLEGDDLALAIRRLVDSVGGTWAGTATELLGRLAEFASESARRSDAWPKTAGALGLRRARLAPVLRKAWRIEFGTHKAGADGARTMTLVRL